MKVPGKGGMRIEIRVVLLGMMGLWAAGFAVAHPRPVADPAAAAPVLAPAYAPAIEAVESHVLRQGETLSEVFQRVLPDDDRGGLILAIRERVDPRRILPNTPVRVLRWVEGGQPRAVEVALNADSTVRLNRQELGWNSEILLTPTILDTVSVAGVLGPGGSLYTALVRNPALELPFKEKEGLVWQLAHIYGWELDFAHDMRPGDSYRVVFEREARPDGTSRSARVLVAELVNDGRLLPAVFFDAREDGGDYYNADGESLRLAFLRYPVDFPRITSNFNWRRYHPILKRSRPHLGTDFGTGRGAPIRSTADGVVAQASWDGGYGNLVRIRHGNGYETRYAHLSRFAPKIRKGSRVKQGQIIGYSGDTGLATAPHLHYEMRQYGRPMDPRAVRLPSAPPVPEEHMAEFRELSEERVALLPALDTTPEAQVSAHAD
jgi:murein DD-endopeptidase MepM/ murein hydrolase activator NlpD